jgi:hypothetical protein
MAETVTRRLALGEDAAFQLANVTKTPPQYGEGSQSNRRNLCLIGAH